MAQSQHIAGLVGPSIMAVTASEALNLDIWEGVAAPLVYLNGCMLFVAGLAIVRAHNIWRRDWRVLVTLTGWAGMAAGLYRMLAPQAPQAGEGVGTYVGVALLFVVGAVITWRAYFPSASARDSA